MTLKTAILRSFFLAAFFTSAISLNSLTVRAEKPDRQSVYASTLHRYQGISQSGVDSSTLTGKVMCGYQGWFRCPNDGSNLGWQHYSGGGFEPGKCSIDLWPDVRELEKDELHKTLFKHKDDSPAFVFSSHNPKTVERHFQWMQQYGIDGVFMQRFVGSTRNLRGLPSLNQVLMNCRDSANKSGRTWALMYDVSGVREGNGKWIIEDWKHLVTQMGISQDKKDTAYLHHEGKPVIALWGLGFKHCKLSLDEWVEVIRFFKNDPKFGGCTVMVGVPTYWRTLSRDSIPDKRLHEVLAMADIISPWTVGRYSSPKDAARYMEKEFEPDLVRCEKQKQDCLPVVFPGFSWQNLEKSLGRESKLNQIPRRKGQFLWSQCVAAKRAGASMIYVAMFDEVDEATAIFKCTNNPPVGKSNFSTYEGLPSDHYLWLTGEVGKMLRGKTEAQNNLPVRKK